MDLDTRIDAQRNGLLATAASTADPATLAAQAKARAEARVKRSTAGTPYSAPGGRWSTFKSYSTLQARFKGSGLT